jgi:hypothetical protein
MEKSLKMLDLKNFVTHIAFSKSFPTPLLLNIMGL